MGVTPPTCPRHQVTMRLKQSRFGSFFSCPRWPDCDIVIGTHPDGTPLGIPTDKEGRVARIRAHKVFDDWMVANNISRGYAYMKLAEALGLSQDECHIARFDVEMCERVIAFCEEG